MKMHKVSLIAALAAGALIALTPSLRAQDTKPARPEAGARAGQRGQMAKERLDKLAVELKLTDEQKTKVEAAMKAQAEKLQGVRDAAPADRREKMQAARKALETELKGILTADQYAQWEKIRQQRGPGGPGARRAGNAEKN
jgi:periplasmic protein CpxP/Spy